jgi:hypothetical protein
MRRLGSLTRSNLLPLVAFYYGKEEKVSYCAMIVWARFYWAYYDDIVPTMLLSWSALGV